MSTLGDIATVAAPTVVAVAAIGASTWQQSRSRRFDRTEREKERQHDREMREAAERHERKLSDLDYQRRLVDDVTEALESARKAMGNLFAEWRRHHRALGASDDKQHSSRLSEIAGKVGEAGEHLRVVNARMVLRFGPSHQAVQIIVKATDALHVAWREVFRNRFGRNDEAQVTESLARAHDDMREAVESFLTVTGGIVGSAPELD